MSRFRRVRIALLLAILAGVLLYAWADVRSRRRRNEWTRTLEVAVILLEAAPIAPDAEAAVRARLPALEMQLRTEQSRYRASAVAPFHFELFGPAHVSRVPPAPPGPGLWELVQYTWELRRYVHAVDAALGVDAGHFDSRVYATVQPPVADQKAHVEGQSEEGGRVAQVRVELDAAMADLALIVVTHELLHTLGALDKYDAAGRSLVPDGLADPAEEPRYPQARVEVMARNRPVSETREEVPSTLAELGIGPVTAREIGWTH